MAPTAPTNLLAPLHLASGLTVRPLHLVPARVGGGPGWVLVQVADERVLPGPRRPPYQLHLRPAQLAVLAAAPGTQPATVAKAGGERRGARYHP